MNGRITVGLVGYGYWGPNLLRNYMELPTARVKWVCDLDRRNLARAQSRYPGVPVTRELGDVLDDPEVDAMLIATPISTHFELAEKSLLAGKHVFVEKPLAASIREAEALTELAEQLELTLMVGHTFEFSPPVRRIKRIIDSGELGEVYFITSSRINLGLHQRDVSVVWDLAPHDFSIIFDWLGVEPIQVSAVGRSCIRRDVPDVAFVTLRFPTGAVAECQLSWLSPVKLRRTMIVGSRKMLLYDDMEPVEKIKLFDHGVDVVDPQSFGEFQMSYRTGDIVSPHLDASEPLQIEATHFVHCVLTGEQPRTDGRSGLRVVRALERAQASLDCDSRNRRVGDRGYFDPRLADR